jgi:Rod binding domain-containing protein
MREISATSSFSELGIQAATTGRGAKAAREFEAQLIASVLDSLQKTFAGVPGDNAVPGAEDYNYLGTQALATEIAAKGGFGIAAMISHYLQSHDNQKT